jgi:hypothetical protein
MNETKELHWRVVRTEKETDRVTNLYLEAIEKRPTFLAGQYLTVRLPDIGPAEGKAYSISSAPHEAGVRLSIKRIGKFSEALLARKPGDELVTSAPYGFFYPEATDQMALVFVAGGIGITPCLSIIKDLLHRGDQRPFTLHYSNQTKADIAFYNELADLEQQHPNLQVTHYITREAAPSGNFISGRAAVEKIMPDIVSAEDTICFICGAMDFTKGLWRQLHQAGVPTHQLYTEGFF